MTIPSTMNKIFDYALTPMTAVPDKFRIHIRNEFRPGIDVYMGATNLIELVYANKEQFPLLVLNTIADLADDAAEIKLGELAIEDRARRISDVIRRMPGVTQRPAVPTTDPVPRADKVIP